MKDLFVQVSVTVVLVTLLPVLSRASHWGNNQDYDQEENEFEDDFADTKWTKSKTNSNSKISSRGNGNGCQREGFQPNPSDCTKFIRCVSQGGSGTYTRFDFDCGPGTVFDENLKLCNHGWALSHSSPCYKGPGSGSGTGSHHKSPSSHTPQQQQQYPAQGRTQNEKPSAYQPPQQSWRSQSQLQNQNQNQWRQPSVRVASSVSAVSVQSTVSTKDSSDSSSQENNSAKQAPETEESTTAESTNNNNNNNNNETGSQPEEEVNLECTNPGTFPHPKNCSKFYRCVEYSSSSSTGGQPTYVIFQYGCSPGEIFDVSLEKCNLIQNVQRAGQGCAIDIAIQPPGAGSSNNNNNENQEQTTGNPRRGYEYNAGPFKLSLGFSGSKSESTTPLPNGLSPPSQNEQNKTREQMAMESSPACPALIALPKDKENEGDDNSTLQVFVSSLSPPDESDSMDSMTTSTTTTTTSTPAPASRIRGSRTRSTTTTTTTTTATPEMESPPEEMDMEMPLTCGRGGNSRKLRANPFDCSKYYSCAYLGDSFVIKVRQCPPGHSFVQAEQRCQESSSDSDSNSCGAGEAEMPEKLTLADPDSDPLTNSSTTGNSTENSNSNGTLANVDDSNSNSTDASSTTAKPTTELINADNTCPSEGNFGIPSDCFRFYNCRYSGPHLTSLLMKCPRGFYFVQGLCRKSSANTREEVTCPQQNVQSDAQQSDGGDDDEAENILQNLGIIVPRKLYHLFLEQEQDQDPEKGQH